MARINVGNELKEDIVTRDHGARLYGLLKTAIATGDQVVVDFDGLQVTSVSFFDEAFGTLAQELGQERFAQLVRYEGIDPFDLALVNDIVLSRCRQRARKGAAAKKLTRVEFRRSKAS